MDGLLLNDLLKKSLFTILSFSILPFPFFFRPPKGDVRHRSDLYDRQFFKDINRRGRKGRKEGKWARNLAPISSAAVESRSISSPSSQLRLEPFSPSRKAGTLNQVGWDRISHTTVRFGWREKLNVSSIFTVCAFLGFEMGHIVPYKRSYNPLAVEFELGCIKGIGKISDAPSTDSHCSPACERCRTRLSDT